MADLPDTEGKSLVDMLDMLKPIPTPEPISMWPATAAWLWLGLALLAGLGWLLWRLSQHRKANAYRRAALAELDSATDDPARVAAILRRTALAAFPRRDLAGLVGQDWLSFLDQAYGGDGFSKGPGRVVERAPYQPQPASPDLTGLARTWVRTHRRERVS